MEYRVGFCQYRPQLMKTETNLKRLEEMLSGVDADLMVLPELAATGYVFKDVNELNSVAEDAQQGKTVKLFRKMAEDNNTSYVVGFAEKAGTDENNKPVIYNSCFLANPNGSYYVYRKLHLFNRETLMFKPGNGELAVHKAKHDVKIGMMVCFDWIFPESVRTLAVRGAQIICHPANLVLPWCQQAMITRSIENRVFTVTSNRVGNEVNGDLEMYFTGQSQITSTKGDIIKRLDTTEEAVWVATIDPEAAFDKMVTDFNHIHNDRRTDKYV